MTSTRPTFTPIYEKGKRLEIQGMAASTIRNNRYQVSQCETCRAYVAWAKSSSGKWYVCETKTYTTEGGNERFRAVPYEFHTCTLPEYHGDENYEGYGERANPEYVAPNPEQIQVQADVSRFMAALRRQADGTATPADDETVAEFHARMVTR